MHVTTKRLKDPDTILCKDQLQALQTMYKSMGPELFCASLIWILTKLSDGGSRIVPFVWKRVQQMLFHDIARNNRVLKVRQPGFTTWFLIVRLFLPAIKEGGIGSMLISQNARYAQEHFMIVRRAYRLICAGDPYDNSQNALNRSLRDNLLHTQYANRRELYFDWLDSKLLVESAETEEAGQGVTLHHVVASEIARWPHDPEATVSNVKGALVKGGTFDEECTANGAGGYFYERYLASMNNPNADAKAHFFPWWATEEYLEGFELSTKEREELRADLQADEIAIIARIHKDLSSIAWTGKAA